MKTRIFQLIVLVFILTGCIGESADMAVQKQLAIIQLSPEMREQVFVTPIVDSCIVDYANSIPNLNTLYYGDGLVLCNPTKEDSVLAEFAQSHLKIVGTNPYIELDNGYAVIDWKWASFHPLSGAWRYTIYPNPNPKIYDHKAAQLEYSTNFYYLNGSLANEEYYLLPSTWKEITKLRKIWPMQEGQYIEKPEVRYINIKDIQKYGHLKNTNIDFNHLLDAYYSYQRDSDNFDAFVEQRDELLASYVVTLNQMINNNDFKKWTRIYK